MTGLRLGPLLRYVDQDTATVWVEAEPPVHGRGPLRGTAAGGSARTFQVAGHHYALVTVVGLKPGTEAPYERDARRRAGVAAARLRRSRRARSARAAAEGRRAGRSPSGWPSAPAAGRPVPPTRGTIRWAPTRWTRSPQQAIAGRRAAGRPAAARRPGLRGRDLRADPAVARPPPRPGGTPGGPGGGLRGVHPACTTSPGWIPRSAGCCPPFPAA